MILYPAIDLKDGHCVRLLRGEMESATVFNDDPAAQARAFESAGFQWIHIVDLDGAFAGRPVNADAVEDILSAVSIPVQLGGGIRDLETAAAWLDRGVRRVIFGTAAVENPHVVCEACREYPGRVVIGIDARDGRVVTDGWAAEAMVAAIELAAEFESVGVSAFVYTDINRDGAMAGPNVEATEAFVRQTEVPVIASGGVASLDDLAALKRIGPYGLNGVISGRALYDGRIVPADALKLLAA